MKPLRYGVIGTSPITQQYIAGADATGRWELCAVYSRAQNTGEAFAMRQGLARSDAFTDLDAFGASSAFDAVYIASPNALHYAHCKCMLEHGKHVICEKPFTSYPWQMEELYAIAAQKGLVLIEAMMFMHQPARLALQQAIAQLGRLHMALFTNCRRSPQYNRLMGGYHPNVFNLELHTGALMDMGVYCLYPALALFGRPDSFTATATLLPVGTDACGVITLQYPETVVELRYSKSATTYMGSEILGDEGYISIGSILHSTNMVLHLADETTREIWGEATKTQLMANEAADFARYILQGAGVTATQGDTAGDCDAVRAEYLHCKEVALLTCEYLEKIRKEIGLAF